MAFKKDIKEKRPSQDQKDKKGYKKTAYQPFEQFGNRKIHYNII